MFNFKKSSFSVGGKIFPARYEIDGEGAVIVHAAVHGIDSEWVTIRFPADHEEHAAALRAATAPEGPEREEPAAVTIIGNPYQDNPKQAHGPVPEKTFIGERIRGNGWQIYFDGKADRTRVIFEREPAEAAVKAVTKAGFYYSENTHSFNKKLTFKAYRAALQLSKKLSAVYACSA